MNGDVGRLLGVQLMAGPFLMPTASPPLSLLIAQLWGIRYILPGVPAFQAAVGPVPASVFFPPWGTSYPIHNMYIAQQTKQLTKTQWGIHSRRKPPPPGPRVEEG